MGDGPLSPEDLPHALVRDLHEEAARDPNLAVASVRPLGTTEFELRLIARDVLRKLDVDPNCSVLEIGCGVGVVGLPLARRARRYLGIDIAGTALEVFRKRLAGAGLADHEASLRTIDFVAASGAAIEALGQFDRVLAYAVLHYVGSEPEGAAFVARALAALKPGGKALFGSLPLSELATEPRPAGALPTGLLRRSATVLRDALAHARPDALGVVRTRRTRVAALAFGAARLLLRPFVRGARTSPASLPSGSTVELSRRLVEEWLAQQSIAVDYRWLPPGVATPLARGRSDLLVTRNP